MKSLEKLRENFKKTMKKVSDITGLSLEEITREDYIRMTVDLRIENRLNKVNLNLIGGFGFAKKSFLKQELKLEKPKVLLFDIETAPILAYTWDIWNVNIGLNQIVEDWSVISWSAKWLGDSEKNVMYEDVRGQKNLRDDSKILKSIWSLLDQADIVITQNGIKFDVKKLNSRFLMNGMPPTSTFKHIDTYRIAKKKFGHTSNKLEHLTSKLCKKYKKQKHFKFPGFELWKECMKDNLQAWKEMEKYNKYDVLSLEELYKILVPYYDEFNFNIYHAEEDIHICKCGSTSFRKSGFHYTQKGKFQKYSCVECNAESRSTENLLSKDKKKNLRVKV